MLRLLSPAEYNSAVEEKDGNVPAILLQSVYRPLIVSVAIKTVVGQCADGNMPWLLCLFQLVEKMIEQARENVSAKKSGRGLRRCGSAMW